NFTLSNIFPYKGTGAPDAQIRMNVVGNSPNNRLVQLRLNSAQVFNATLISFNYAKLSTNIPVANLTGTTETFSVTNETNTANNRIKVAFIELIYPRIFNFGGASNFKFKLSSSSSGKYLEITGFSYSGTPVLYDFTNGRRYEANVA